ncbi:MAG TPA: sensor domain-containing diguanylate cyclase [Oscillospiraceae bacterium]|nr:sensor domain-containing diguanylate cyclase [Oscillospiraceae bacterium]HRW57120.1 sensor domain-containing diguanylate cyclase [Oscillospiraceae bacterium]
MIKVLFKQKKAFIQYAIFIFLLLSLIILSISSFLQYKLNEAKKIELLNNEQSLIRTEDTIISNRINRISGDLLYVADCFRLNDNGDGDYSEVEKQWVAFSNRKMIYDQIRFIDTDGNEIIRVNYYDSGAVLVDKANLQNKKERYYFTDTIKLSENQIYISKLDLNIENDEIEQPIKPMMRISTPYYVNGELKGIFVLNYLANDMLNQVAQVASTSSGNIFMLNSDGYWLYNSASPDKEWAFMYEDKKGVSFSNEFPEEWKTVRNKNDGYQISENGVFLYSSFMTGQAFSQDNGAYSYVLGSGDWILVSWMPADSAKGFLFTQNLWTTYLHTMQNNYYSYIIILLIAVIIAALVAINKNGREQIKYFSEYDTMTGVYNRRAGFEKLSQLYKKSTGKPCTISICFIDINGLKEVNDALGHEVGDELIRSVVSGVKQNIRENDFLARLGGDEFLIIFEGLDENKAEEVWKRVVNEYDHVNEAENRAYLISVSHGIESFQCGSDSYIDTVVNHADEKMYEEKRQIKKALKVLKS